MMIPEKYFTKEVLDKIDEIDKTKIPVRIGRRRTIKDTLTWKKTR